MPPQDPQSDQDFLKANPKDQHAYLMATDPDYAKAGAQDQFSYLQQFAPKDESKPGGWQRFKEDISNIFKPSGFNPYPGMGQEEKAAAAGQSYEQDQSRKAAGYSKPYRMLAPVAQSVGVNVPGMEESAREGDEGGVVGHMMAPLAALGTAEVAGHTAGPVMRTMERAGRTAMDVVPVVNRVSEAWHNNSPEAVAHRAALNDPLRMQTQRAIELRQATPVPLRVPRMRGVGVAPGEAGSMAESVEGVRGTLPAGRGRMVLTPEELAQQDMLDRIAARNASRRGMNFAGGMVPREGRSVPFRPRMNVVEEWRNFKPSGDQ